MTDNSSLNTNNVGNKNNNSNNNNNNNTLNQTVITKCNPMHNYEDKIKNNAPTLAEKIINNKNNKALINNSIKNYNSNTTLASTSTVDEFIENNIKKNTISSILRNTKKSTFNDDNLDKNPTITDGKRSLPTNITFAPVINNLLPQPTTIADRFVQQHHPHIHSQNQQQRFLPRVKPQFRKLKKYASETCFYSPLPHINTNFSVNSSATNSIETPSPPGINSRFSDGYPLTESVLETLNSGGENILFQNKASQPLHLFQVREVKNNNNSNLNYRFFAPNQNNNNNNNITNVCSSGATVINKIYRRRQDSDDASGSIGSETTVASGTMSPQSRRNLRLKLRRPISTGNVVQMNPHQNLHSTYTMHNNNNNNQTSGRHSHYSGGSSGGVFDNTAYYNQNHNNYGTNNSGNYDTSYTSATLHSLDDSFQHVHADTYSNGAPGLFSDDRRPSNFYLFEDDSNHEFDDEIIGIFFIILFKIKLNIKKNFI